MKKIRQIDIFEYIYKCDKLYFLQQLRSVVNKRILKLSQNNFPMSDLDSIDVNKKREILIGLIEDAS